MSVYQQVVDRQGAAVACASQQVFVIVPEADWDAAAVFAFSALPLGPLNAAEFVFVGQFGRQEDRRPARLDKTFDLFGDCAGRQWSLPNQQRRFLPVDFTNTIGRQFGRFKINATLCAGGCCEVDGTCVGFLFRDDYRFSDDRVGESKIPTVVAAVWVGRQFDFSPTHGLFGVDRNPMAKQ